MKKGTALAVGTALLLLAGCSGMRGFDATPHTKAPHGDRFAKAWCEAHRKDGTTLTCGSAPPPIVQPGQACECLGSNGDPLVLGRIVGTGY